VATVTVTPAATGGPPKVEVQGKLEGLIGMEGVVARAVSSGGISGSGDWI
jgi:hypothetical protein